MAAAQEAHDDHLDAFMNGFEFVLLAMRGRLAEAKMPANERARLESFLADYNRLVEAYRNRTPQAESPRIAVRRFQADALPPSN